MTLPSGTRVRFAFTLPRVSLSDPIVTRSGTGEIADDEINFSCWPVGQTVRVLACDDYPPGTPLAVSRVHLWRLP